MISNKARESMKSDAQIRAETYPLTHPLFETIRDAAINSNVYHFHVGGMESPLFDEVAKMVIELLPKLQQPKPKREWISPEIKPPCATPVLVKLRPRRKNQKPVVSIGSYWTPGKDHHDDHASWFLDYPDDLLELQDKNILGWSAIEE